MLHILEETIGEHTGTICNTGILQTVTIQNQTQEQFTNLKPSLLLCLCTWNEPEAKVGTGWVLWTGTSSPTGKPEGEGWAIGGCVLVYSTHSYHCHSLLLILIDDWHVVLRKDGIVVIDVTQGHNQSSCTSLWWRTWNNNYHVIKYPLSALHDILK